MEYTFCDNVFSDLHKDVYGFRPRNHPYDNASDEDKQIIWDNLCAELELNEKNARAAEQEAVEEFEKLVAKTIGYGASDRTAALRWITQSETFYHMQCVEQFVWEKGLLFTTYGEALIEELAKIVTFEEVQWN